MKKNMDAALVAAKENHESEVKYISKRYKIPIKAVREAMKATGKNGKPCRSRKVIYAYLRNAGWEIKTKKK